MPGRCQIPRMKTFKKEAAPMPRKNQRPCNFTDWQAQQLKRNNQSLRKLNRAARCELRVIGRMDLTHRQYRKAGESFGSIATRMIGALRFHHAIVKAGPEQQPLRIVVSFVTPCVDGSENQPSPYEKSSRIARIPRSPLDRKQRWGRREFREMLSGTGSSRNSC